MRSQLSDDGHAYAYMHNQEQTLRLLRGCVHVANIADDASAPDFWTVVRLEAFHRLQGRSFVSLSQVLLAIHQHATQDPADWTRVAGVAVPKDVPVEQQELWRKKICVVLRASNARDQRNDWEQLPDLFVGDSYETEPPSESHLAADAVVTTLALRIRAPPLAGLLAPLAEQMMLLHSITQAVRSIAALEEPAIYIDDDKRSTVKFELESIDLDLKTLEIQASVFKAITELLETGVTVHSLSFPQRLPTPTLKITDDPLLGAWKALCGVICGNVQLHAGASEHYATVRRVVVTTMFTEIPELFVPFFSALCDSRTVEILKIQFDNYPSGNGDENANIFWKRLSVALFGATSTSSIQCLDLDGLILTPMLLDQVIQVCCATEPERMTSSPTGSDDYEVERSISIISPPPEKRHGLQSLRVRYNGDVQPSQRVENKRSRRLVARLAQIPAVGSDLRELRVDDCWSFTDKELEMFLYACPQLEHLRLSGTNFTSDCLRRAYEQGAVLSSLDITSGNFSIDEFESLLALLTVEGQVKTTLKQLHIDRLLSKQFRSSTAELLESVLRDSTTLTHLQLFESVDEDALSRRFARFHGQIVPSGRVPLRERLAFVSCQQVSRLDQDAVALIFEMTGPTTLRSIIVKKDELSVVTWAELF